MDQDGSVDTAGSAGGSAPPTSAMAAFSAAAVQALAPGLFESPMVSEIG